MATSSFFAASLYRIRSNGDWHRYLSDSTFDMSGLTMLAAALRSFTDPRRACAIALMWLLALTILNVQTGALFRSTALFALPVAIVAWRNCQLGFLFAAISVIAAKYGGAMPEPGSSSPLWLDAMLAFAKLSIDAVVVNAWGRHRRRLASSNHEADDVPSHGRK